VGIDDPAVRDAKVIESTLPSDEGVAIGASPLDRSIHTDLRCAYLPTGDDADVNWEIVT